MNLTALKTLQAILLHGNFTAAGAAVGCSPSAVSLQVKQLEKYFGQPLFDRSTRTVRATPFAMEMAGTVADFSARMEALRARSTVVVEGKFRLGAITSMQSDLLPPVLRLLRQRHPALDLRIPPLNDTRELLAELRAGRIDAALVVRPEGGGSARLAWRDVYRQPYVLLAPPGGTETEPRTLLKYYPWIAYDTSLTGGRVAARHVRALAPETRIGLELRSMEAIVSMVAQGMGVAVIPQPRRLVVSAHGVREIGLGRPAPVRRIALAWRQADTGDRKIAAVLQAFEAVPTQA